MGKSRSHKWKCGVHSYASINIVDGSCGVCLTTLIFFPAIEWSGWSCLKLSPKGIIGEFKPAWAQTMNQKGKAMHRIIVVFRPKFRSGPWKFFGNDPKKMLICSALFLVLRGTSMYVSKEAMQVSTRHAIILRLAWEIQKWMPDWNIMTWFDQTFHGPSARNSFDLWTSKYCWVTGYEPTWYVLIQRKGLLQIEDRMAVDFYLQSTTRQRTGSQQKRTLAVWWRHEVDSMILRPPLSANSRSSILSSRTTV